MTNVIAHERAKQNPSSYLLNHQQKSTAYHLNLICCLFFTEASQIGLRLRVLRGQYFGSDNAISSFSIMDSIPAHIPGSLRASRRRRLAAGHPLLVVVRRTAMAAASHQWLLDACSHRRRRCSFSKYALPCIKCDTSWSRTYCTACGWQ